MVAFGVNPKPRAHFDLKPCWPDFHYSSLIEIHIKVSD